MAQLQPKDIISDFLNMIFLLFLIAFSVFYFIIGDHWGTAEKIVKIAMNLSVFFIFFLFKVKIVLRKIKEEKEKENNDIYDIAVYFNKKDKRRSLISILFLILLMFLIAYFLSPDFNAAFWQLFVVFLFLFVWHIYLFTKRDSYSLRMYATVLMVLIDSLVIYFVPVIIFGISFFLDYYSFFDVINSILALVILSLRHKILFELNKKK